jgi:trimethylamine-N-oxide reductase (cytochrome c)
MLAQHPWLENDCLFADIILPSNTKFETDDIGSDMESAHFSTVYRERKCVEPIGESKSDYEVVIEIAKKLGLEKEYTEGKSIEEWIKHGFDQSGVPEAGLFTWEELCEKDYYVIPTDPEWKKYRAGMIEFYEDPKKHPMTTPSGLIEFYSQGLAEHFPDDEERPPVPHWIPYGESHQESLLHERARKYPLLVCSNHPRWRVHAQLDDINWFHEIVTGKVRGPDGYLYEPVWLHPSDAKKRGINNGDICQIYNERGIVLAGAYVTERIMPSVAYIDHGARYDPIVPGVIDRGGAINTITPHLGTSRNCRGGMVVSGFLVEVAKADMDELRRKYPEAFGRPYHRGSGLDFNRVLAGGK